MYGLTSLVSRSILRYTNKSKFGRLVRRILLILKMKRGCFEWDVMIMIKSVLMGY